MSVSRRFSLFVVLLVVCTLGYIYNMQFACWTHTLSRKPAAMQAERSYHADVDFQAEDVKGISTDDLQPPDWTQASISGLVPSVVHYIWCGDKKFRFKDYLGVLSAIKMFRPLKLLFHHTHPPQTDDYNVWFKTLQSSTPGLEMQEMSSPPSCGSVDMLRTALGFLSDDGGIFLGETIILSPGLTLPVDNKELWFTFSDDASDKTRGIVIAKQGFNESVIDTYLRDITASTATQPGCASPDHFRFSTHGEDNYCVTVPGDVYPRDIIDAHIPFAELARLIFYGRRDPMVPVQNARNLIPRISHFVRFTGKKVGYADQFTFSHFLNVLSALYVAGFERVYLHVDVEPRGRWWQELAKENVTVVKVVRADSVFQQPVHVIQHVSDITRYLLLYKYGGAYQDFDVTWTSRVPDSLLSYPFVTGLDWVVTGGWPAKCNQGVMLTRPGSQWLHHFIESHKDFRDNSWEFNSLLMSYRTYELYPHLMYLDRKLQVICHYGICHPTWEKSYRRRISNRRRTLPFRWQDVRSLHITRPKPHPSLTSPEGVRDGQDMFAEVGRFILKESGRLHLLRNSSRVETPST